MQGDELMDAIAHGDGSVKEVVFEATKAIVDLSHARDLVMKTPGINATSTMLVIDVVLSDLVTKSCNWVSVCIYMFIY